ncbi:MAG: isoamylase early set domain-containing protein [Bacteroidia bacterium]|nr:isoamylase early set domain-containing protein [Bacteroidia bacterium]
MITKKFLKTKDVCKVTFKLPKEAVQNAKSISIVGDFNNWNPDQHFMIGRKDGSFSTTLNLPKNENVQFRYLIDGSRWKNEDYADSYAPTPYWDAQNSVLHL